MSVATVEHPSTHPNALELVRLGSCGLDCSTRCKLTGQCPDRSIPPPSG